MNLALINFRRVLLAFCALAAVVCLGQTADSTKSAAKEQKKASAAGSELQRLLDQLAAHREMAIADSEKLARELKNATDAQKKEILAKMEAQKKAFEEASSAFMKQIADERRKQRAASKR